VDRAVELAEQFGVRNSQATVLAPTGTIGLLMDCDTTGVEPDLGLVKTKEAGRWRHDVDRQPDRAACLAAARYSPAQVGAIVAYIDEHKTIVGAPDLTAEHLAVFACSMGDNTIHYSGHVRMMGAVQPFISGAISKTVNMPEDVTVDDIEQLHIDAWRLGIKAVAIYRDNCKVGQPLSTRRRPGPRAGTTRRPVRRRRPTTGRWRRASPSSRWRWRTSRRGRTSRSWSVRCGSVCPGGASRRPSPSGG